MLGSIIKLFKSRYYDRNLESRKIFDDEKCLKDVKNSGVKIKFNFADNIEKIFSSNEYVLAYFPAGRKANILMAKGVENVQLLNSYRKRAVKAPC